jgi:tetratricopeptide (TPR) repeat protein
VQADVLHRVATSGALAEPTREHLAVGERAVMIAREVGATVVEFHALNTVGVLRVFLVEIDEGFALLREVCAQSRTVGDPYLQARAYNNLASLQEQLGRPEEAVETARQCLAIARHYGLNTLYGALILDNLVESLLALGRHREAEELLAAGNEQFDDAAWGGRLHRLHAELALLRGDLRALVSIWLRSAKGDATVSRR